MPAPNPLDTPWNRAVTHYERQGMSLEDAVRKALEIWPDTRTVVFYLYNRSARTAFTKLARSMIRERTAIDYQYRSSAELKAEGVEYPDPRGYVTMASRNAPVDWELWAKLVEEHGAREEVYDDDYEPLPEQEAEPKRKPKERIVLRKLPRVATEDGVCGLCFPWALREVTVNGGVLVHGTVTAPLSDPPHSYAHAWVEHEGTVYDWQTMEAEHGGKWTGKGYPKDVFYELFQPENMRRYTRTEALEQNMLHGHDGPWENDNPAPRKGGGGPKAVRTKYTWHVDFFDPKEVTTEREHAGWPRPFRRIEFHAPSTWGSQPDWEVINERLAKYGYRLARPSDRARLGPDWPWVSSACLMADRGKGHKPGRVGLMWRSLRSAGPGPDEPAKGKGVTDWPMGRPPEQDNPTWHLDGEEVETDHGPKGWEYTWKKGHEPGPFASEHEALKHAMKQVAVARRPIAIIGDRDPITYDGGIVYQAGDPPRYYLRYFDTYRSDGEHRVTVYEIAIERDITIDLDWVDWDELADYMDEGPKTVRRQAKSKDPVERATIYEAVGRLHSFGELDKYADDMTVAEAERLYEADVDAVREAERRKRNPIAEMRQRRKQKETRRERFYRLLRRM